MDWTMTLGVKIKDRQLFGTYEGFDALQDKVAGDVAWQVLAKLSN